MGRRRAFVVVFGGLLVLLALTCGLFLYDIKDEEGSIFGSSAVIGNHPANPHQVSQAPQTHSTTSTMSSSTRTKIAIAVVVYVIVLIAVSAGIIYHVVNQRETENARLVEEQRRRHDEELRKRLELKENKGDPYNTAAQYRVLRLLGLLIFMTTVSLYLFDSNSEVWVRVVALLFLIAYLASVVDNYKCGEYNMAVVKSLGIVAIWAFSLGSWYDKWETALMETLKTSSSPRVWFHVNNGRRMFEKAKRNAKMDTITDRVFTFIYDQTQGGNYAGVFGAMAVLLVLLSIVVCVAPPF